MSRSGKDNRPNNHDLANKGANEQSSAISASGNQASGIQASGDQASSQRASTSKNSFVIYDTEYWSDRGSMKRRHGGLQDEPPMLIEIGACRIRADAQLSLIEEFETLVTPKNVSGAVMTLPQYFIELTGITNAQIQSSSKSLSEVMPIFHEFCAGDPIYAYGKDMLYTIVPSCFLQKVHNPFLPEQSKDIRLLLCKAGMSKNTICKLSSGQLAAHFNVSPPLTTTHRPHRALFDVHSILAALRQLVSQAQLQPEWFVAS